MDPDTSCGLGDWRPRWIQKLARTEVYMVVYCLIGIIHGMGFNYLCTVFSTMEKQFEIKSEETVWIFASNELSQILLVFALPFLGLIKRRPLWMSVAMILGALGLLCCTIPFFIREPKDYRGGWNNQRTDDGRLCNPERNTTECSTKVDRDHVGMATIFIGILIFGIGASVFHSFGVPYIDDNVSKDKSPAYLGIIYGTRTLGPALGAVLGNLCLKIYVYPGLGEGLAEGDDGWLGAWWLGFFIIGSSILIFAPFLSLFPQRLPDTSSERTDAEVLDEKEKKDGSTGIEFMMNLKAVIGRLLKNRVYILNLTSTVTAMFGFSGLTTFFPKYVEYHFRKKASSSALVSVISSFGIGLGIMGMGLLISKFKFKARTISGWSVFSGFINILLLISLGFIACPKLEVYYPVRDGSLCAESCDCQDSKFLPTCSADGETLFFSPCSAGCRSEGTVMVDGLEKTVFYNCSCVPPLTSENDFRHEAVLDFCPSSCETMYIFTLSLLAIVAFLESTVRVGDSIIVLRVVEPEDKSASLVILMSSLSLLALFPSPIVFGALLDQTCVVWGDSCGQMTNCQLYDTDLMRQYITWFPAACLTLSILADLGVWWFVGDLQLYQEEQPEDPATREENSINVVY